MVKIQSLQSSCKSEIKKREALEFTTNTLKSGVFFDLKQLRWKWNLGPQKKSFKRFGSQSNQGQKFKRVGRCHVCGETRHYARECKDRKSGPPAANSFEGIQHLVANLHMEEIDMISEASTRIMAVRGGCRDSLAQKSANESTISQLHQDLVAHKNHVEALAKRLDRVHSDVEMTCELLHQLEMQDLKHRLMMEQEEKNGLNRKFADSRKG
ncbi:Zinc finger, CCHC-type, partial [Cynara cardunculus var. scolymus]